MVGQLVEELFVAVTIRNGVNINVPVLSVECPMDVQGLSNNQVLEHVKAGNTLNIPAGVKTQL